MDEKIQKSKPWSNKLFNYIRKILIINIIYVLEYIRLNIILQTRAIFYGRINVVLRVI